MDIILEIETEGKCPDCNNNMIVLKHLNELYCTKCNKFVIR